MPEIDYNELKKKLAALPPANREAAILDIKKAGYTWNASPTEQKGGIINSLVTKDLDGASKLDPFAQAARLGQFANEGNQKLASVIAEKGGEYEAKRSAEQGDAVELPLPKFLAGGKSGQTVQMGALPGIAAAGALGTASEFALPQNRLGVAGYFVQPAMKGYQALKGVAKAGAKPGVAAQLGMARTKVPSGDIQQAINDPSVFKAPSVEEANKAYGVAAGPVQGATKSLAKKLDKVILGEADYTEAINRAGRIVGGTELVADATGNMVPVKMDPQTALEGVQSINRFLKNKAFTSKLDKPQIAEILTLKNELMTWMESNGSPGLRAAATVLRKAHVKENLSKVMPQNKFGGTDALRTMAAGGTAAGAASLALAGYPLAALPLAAEAITASPAFLGGAIRNYHTLSNPKITGTAAAIAALRSQREKK